MINNARYTKALKQGIILCLLCPFMPPESRSVYKYTSISCHSFAFLLLFNA